MKFQDLGNGYYRVLGVRVHPVMGRYLTNATPPRENKDMDNTNKCAECSSDGTPDETADVTHCENCGLPIEGRRSLWT